VRAAWRRRRKSTSASPETKLAWGTEVMKPGSRRFCEASHAQSCFDTSKHSITFTALATSTLPSRSGV
jgi:hypothetical protein